MATMKEAIKSVLITELKTALASYFPSTPVAIADEYINFRPDNGDPPAMTGQWYVAVHAINSRNETQKAGQPYIYERWSCAVTITVRTAYAANSRISDAYDLMDTLLRAASARFLNRQWEMLYDINTSFNATYATTNGLTEPFLIQNPMPRRGDREPQWLKAISTKKSSHPSSISATINLVNALQIQTVGGIV